MSNNKIDIKKGIPTFIHIIFCFVILVIPLLVMSRNGTTELRHYPGYFIRTGVLIILFYVNYLYLIDKFLFKRQFVLYFLINIALIIGTIFFQNIFFELVLGPRPPMENIRRPDMPNIPRPPREMRLLSDYVLTILAVGMSVAVKATLRWHKDSINLETVKAAQLEADLKNLRSQLNPHFLFNTLNNIYSLIATDTHKAQESVHRLSHLLRYILYENDRQFVPISKELEFTRNYIDLMRLRLSPNVKLDVLIKNENCNKPIAPLLIITIIENAFKHGINNGTESFIDIKIFVDEDKGVLCTVENSLGETKNDMEAKNSGIGLTNLRKRLELLYPQRYELTVSRKEDRFSVLLCVNFDDDKETEE